MEPYLQLITMTLIGGLIGFTTNKIAVRMLFRPIQPRKILFFKVQGLLPKRKSLIAASMGKTIEAELLSKDDIFNSFMTPTSMEKFKDILKRELAKKLSSVVPSMFRSMLGPNLDTMIHQFIDTEGDRLIKSLFDHIKDEGLTNLDIPKLVEERVDAMDFLKFESLVLNVVRKELRHIEYVGLFLGLMIGFVQFLIVNFL